MKHRSKVLLYLVVGCLLTWLSLVHGNIVCVSPDSGTFKAGDNFTLNWSSDGTSPTTTDIVSMAATLFCDSGVQIASVPITNFNGSVPWTVPSVGNATTGGGTIGTCPANSFHVEYSGVAKDGLFGILRTSFDNVRCGSVTITPAPNNTITTTTITTTIAPSTVAPTSTTTRATMTTTVKASPTATESADQNKPKTYIIVIVAIVAALILVLVAFGTWMYLRKQRIRRMQDAIMPWSSPPNNQFAKVSSMDEGSRAPSLNSRSAGVVAAASGAAMYGLNKAQPKIPQPAAGYYPSEGYGYNQQGAGGGYGVNRQQDYSNEDEYYNPYYAQGGPNPAVTNATYYSDSRTPYQTPQDPFQGQQQLGYFPPPPPVSSGAQGVGLPSSAASLMTSGSSMTSLPKTLTSSTLTSSSVRRGPQVILPEMGHRSNDDATQDIPLKDMTLSP